MRSQTLTTIAAALIATTLAPMAHAADGRKDAVEFHELLRSALPADSAHDNSSMALIHTVPDDILLQALQASSIQDAIQKTATTSYEKLVRATLTQSGAVAADGSEALARQPLTIVLVPGIFGEFITTRAFEDVLSKPSKERDDFQAKVLAAGQDANATDLSFDMGTLDKKSMSLSDLISVGSLNDANGRLLARVVLLYTPFMSLESMGDLKEHAGIFNRRLSKYLALTGSQRMAFVGYSRGTDLALEMLAQAQSQQMPWVSDVKGMISLGGVVWGSTLADATQVPDSAKQKAIAALKTLRNELDPTSKRKTFVAWGHLGESLQPLLPDLQSHGKTPSSDDLVNSTIPMGVDTSSVITLVQGAAEKLGLTNPLTAFSSEFGNNVRRFQHFLDAILSGVDSLTSSSREAWWKSHTLPQNVTYYAVTAAMANPELSAVDLRSFDGPFGYAKRSYDDLALLQNRLDYEAMSGVTLNDSQVAVPQAAFLPQAIARLNPANAGLKTEFLGTVGTHHWGLALRVVNAMQDGRMNPFPREALLKALAEKVALDQTK